MKTINLMTAFAVIIPTFAAASDPMPCDEYAEIGRHHLQARYDGATITVKTIERAMVDNTFRVIVSQAYDEPLIKNQTLGLDDFSARMFYQCLRNKV